LLLSWRSLGIGIPMVHIKTTPKIHQVVRCTPT
jgi:hypothetical protein